MISFSLKVVNADKVSFAFGGLAASIKDWRKSIWPIVRSDAIRPWLRKQFASQGRQGSHGKWAALSPAYAAQKARRYPGKPILEASGAMKNDLLSESNEGETTAQTMLYGTKIKYALFHQTGTKGKSGKPKMPARRIFDPESGSARVRGSMPFLIRVAVARGVAQAAKSPWGFEISGEPPASFAGSGIPVSEGI